jgi:oligopeptide transport system substrate-binding protein
MLSEWQPNAVIVVSKNPNYWDAARVRLNEIRFYPIADVTTAEHAYRAGQLHLSSVPPAKRTVYREQSASALHAVTQLGTRLLRLQTIRTPFLDVRLRRAFSLALDRERLVSSVLAGFGAPAHSLTMPGTGGYQPPASIVYDPVEARRLLAEAGHAGGAGFPTLELLISGNDGETVALAEAMQQMWRRELGVEVKILANEGTVFLDSVRSGNFQISLSNWRLDLNDPVDQLLLGVADYPSNQTGWKNAAYDRSFVRSEEAATEAERRAAFDEMEKLLAVEMPFIPLFHSTNAVLVHPTVQGWRDNGLGYIDWRELWLAAPK